MLPVLQAPCQAVITGETAFFHGGALFGAGQCCPDPDTAPPNPI
jgi:hypothetical protein